MADITAKLSVKSGMNASMSRGGGGGQPGPPGYSPSASVEKVGDTATITITDKDGTTTAQVNDGTDGQDGYSPSASVSKSGDTVTITVTDKNGTTTAQVSDGTDGEDGDDGITPTTTVTTITGGHNVAFSYGSGDSRNTDFDVMDGSAGHSPVVTASKAGKVTTVSVDGTAIATINDGEDGATPVKGTDYWTTADKAAMVQDVLDALDEAEGVSY